LHAKRRIIGREVDEIAAASAWVERSEGGRAAARTPLVPRLLIKLSEGSLVKLGANGQLRFVELSPARALADQLRGKFGITEPKVSG
jgi:hypothetical protein